MTDLTLDNALGGFRAIRYSLVLTALFAVGCDVDQTQEGRLPDVDVSADADAGNLPEYEIVQTEEGDLPDVDVDVDSEAGRLPSFDVEWADIDVNMSEQTVTVPKLEVVMEEETISVPVIDVDMPDDQADRDRVRRTLTAAAMVPGDGYSMEISRVYRSNNSLLVVSTLEGESEGGNKQMVNDSVVINAPEADVRHIVIGQRPSESFNEQFRYVPSMRALQDELSNAKLLYERAVSRSKCKKRSVVLLKIKCLWREQLRRTFELKGLAWTRIQFPSNRIQLSL